MADQPAQPPKFLDQVRGAIRLRRMSYRTEQAYVDWAKRFILFHNKRHPKEMGAPEIEAFIAYLVNQRNVSSQLRDASAGSGPRHPHCAGTARPRACEHADGLHARAQRGRTRCAQPARSSVAYPVQMARGLPRFAGTSASSPPPPTKTSSARGAVVE